MVVVEDLAILIRRHRGQAYLCYPHDDNDHGDRSILVAAVQRVPPQLYFVVSAVFHYLGPAFAVLLFARVDVLGVAWLRIVVGGADLRALAPAVAGASRAWTAPAGGCWSAWGVVLAADERLLLRGDRPPPARHGRRDRVPAGDRARRARRAERPQRRSRWRSPSPASTCSRASSSRASRSGSRSPSPTRCCSPSTSCSPTGSRATRSSAASTASPRRCSIAAVVVTPIGGWAVVPALADPVALAGGHRRRGVVVGDPLRLRPARDAPAGARDLRADGLDPAGDRHRDRHRRAGPGAGPTEIAGVALVIAGVALHREPREEAKPVTSAAERADGPSARARRSAPLGSST